MQKEELDLTKIEDRFKFILEKIGGSQRRLAEYCETSASYINNILFSGKQPGTKIYQAIKKNLPEWNLNWVITGDGPVYNQSKHNENKQYGEQNVDTHKETPIRGEHDQNTRDLLEVVNKQLEMMQRLTYSNEMLIQTNRDQSQIISRYIDKEYKKIGEIGRTSRIGSIRDVAPH